MTPGTTDATPVAAGDGEPLILGFDAGFTAFMAMDVELAEKGILTKLDMIQNQWEGRRSSTRRRQRL